MQNGLFSSHKFVSKNESINRLIKDYEKQYANLFKKVKTDWNINIRNFMRDSTGVKLNKKGSNPLTNYDSFVHVSIEPDYDNEFIRLIDLHFPDLDFDEFLSLRIFLDSLHETIFYFENDEHVQAVALINYCNDYFNRYNLEKIIAILFFERSKSTDILGTYNLNSHSIAIYYLPLIIFSKLQNIQTEYLFAVVLAHEFAHAFHHIGFDSDGYIWSNMKNVDTETIESLAQYYTERFVEDYSDRFPSLMTCYKTLLKSQRGPYLIHEKWNKIYKREHVKRAFLQSRRNNITKFSDFEKILDDAKVSLN